MSKYPWDKDYKMTLYIYPVLDCGEDLKGGDPLEVSIEGENVELLKEQIDELIVKTIDSFNAHDGDCFVEMSIEEDGEYFDSEEFWVRVDLENKIVNYEESCR